jgi:hypothetical protein
MTGCGILFGEYPQRPRFNFEEKSTMIICAMSDKVAIKSPVNRRSKDCTLWEQRSSCIETDGVGMTNRSHNLADQMKHLTLCV